MKNIYLFFGENTYSSQEKLKFWQQEFAKKYGEDAIETIEGHNLNPAQFTTDIEAQPFLSEKRLIIIKDFLAEADAEDQKRVAEHLDKAIDECILVFYETQAPDKRLTLFKKITKIGQAEEFKALHPNDLAKWILDRANKNGLKINFPTANYLIQHSGTNLWVISGELEKLGIYADGKEITSTMIDEVSIPSLTASIFKLTDAIAQKNVKQSLKTFKIMSESGEDLMMVFFMIVRHFRILVQVLDLLKQGENQNSITTKLQQHPYVIQKSSQQSRNFTIEKLEKIYCQLLDIDRKFKTGVVKTYSTDNREYELLIEQLIIDCCK